MKELRVAIRSVVKKIILGLTSLIFYLPIILGILAPMLIAFALFFYISWELTDIFYPIILWGYIILSDGTLIVFILIEIGLFLIGLALFLSGFLEMTRKKSKERGLIQSGIYKYIRHPQNLGIILIFLPFALYIPYFSDIGIRVGEIISYSFFALLIIFYSFYEEFRMKKKYKKDFLDYYKNSGFFFPNFSLLKEKLEFKKHMILKIVITMVSFILFQSLYILLLQNFSNILIYLR